MQPYLVFGLIATLGAMGELAGHERRGALNHPARSAVIGLMGAALGIRRDGDFAALDVLEIAVAEFDQGAGLRDYHTTETVPSAAAKKPNSRPEALRDARGRTNTTITLRDYRAGAFFGIAVWGGEIWPPWLRLWPRPSSPCILAANPALWPRLWARVWWMRKALRTP